MKNILSFLLLGMLTRTGNTQIVITKTDFTSKVNIPIVRANDTVVADANTSSQINALAAKSGKGQTWDLSQLHFSTVDTTIRTVLAGTTGAAGAADPALAFSNYVFKDNTFGSNTSTLWFFLTINDNGVSLNGMTKDNNGTLTNKTVYNPPVLPYGFPIQFGAKWVETTLDSTVTYQGLQVKLHVVVSDEVDGEGTLIRTSPIPNVNCLRIKTKQLTTASASILTLYDTSYSYSFINNSDFNLGAFSPQHTAASPFPSQLNVSLSVTETAPVLLNGVRDADANSSFAMQNSPNPFSTETTISYSLTNSSYVKIVIHDMLGKEIAVLTNSFVDAGIHSLNFDATKLSPGCYFCTITTNGISQTKQMVVIR
jgi:hypothetical protein